MLSRDVRAVTGFIVGLWVLALIIASAAVVGTVGVLPFVVLPRGRRERRAMRGARAWAWTALKILRCRVQRHGTMDLPDDQGALIFANHRSWLDPILLMHETRSNGLSKSEIFWLPVIGVYGWISGAVFFNRRSKEQRTRAREEVIWLAERGHRLQVFPEGTRNRGPVSRERVYLRLAMDAYTHGIPVVPCCIVNSERILPPDELGAFPGHEVQLHILPALWPKDFDNPREFGDAAWSAVVQRWTEATECPERESNPHAP